jgi:hypothetical protein
VILLVNELIANGIAGVEPDLNLFGDAFRVLSKNDGRLFDRLVSFFGYGDL